MRYRLRVAASAGSLIAASLVASGCGTSSQSAGERQCARAVIEDWSDGVVDGVYPDNCYLAAIDALPEDLRAYTSAGDDIRRALQSRRGAPSGRE